MWILNINECAIFIEEKNFSYNLTEIVSEFTEIDILLSKRSYYGKSCYRQSDFNYMSDIDIEYGSCLAQRRAWVVLGWHGVLIECEPSKSFEIT